MGMPVFSSDISCKMAKVGNKLGYLQQYLSLLIITGWNWYFATCKNAL